MSPQTIRFTRCLIDSIAFPATFQGNRQHGTWARLVGYIASAESLTEFDKATAYAEGYVHALVDSKQLDISVDRDVLIIATMDAWRCARTYPNTSTNLSYPGKP
ncbi:hypothetical protein CQZ99_10075 [Pseudomonas poae]|uniref:Uncharacterized protein n=1 Tax=Pseudomonas poae TaxID=200451 RepID=A0A2S9EUK3_9PSED|nr:hypothetical protein CQZ97_00530 [Pseudomonas poae]PRC19684.1 hypothetical protein CQZ99_10075 [Pseudomonas poae]